MFKGIVTAGIVLVFLLSVVLLSMAGCTHALEIKNIGSYTKYGMMPLEKNITIGVVPTSDDIHCEKLVRNIADSLQKYGAKVWLPYSPYSSRKVDVVANIRTTSDYHGSGWNFLINFPGFLIFTPAWNGYVYKVNYDVDVLLKNTSDDKMIGTFNLPIRLNVRHADMSRTWTEISWFEVGVIALISGIVFIGYDDDISLMVIDETKTTIGDYIALEIVSRINSSGAFSVSS